MTFNHPNIHNSNTTHKTWNNMSTDAWLCHSIYTHQNKLRVTQLSFPYVVYLVSSVAQTRQAIEKRVSSSFKGVKNKAFPLKNLAFKIFVFILFKIYHFAKKIKKSCLIAFIVVWTLCYQLDTVKFSSLTMLYALPCRYPQSKLSCL